MCEINTNASIVLQRLQTLRTNLFEKDLCTEMAAFLHSRYIDRIINALESLVNSSKTDEINKEWILLFLRRLTRTITGIERLCEINAYGWEKITVLEKPIWTLYDDEITCIGDEIPPQTQTQVWQRFIRVKDIEVELHRRKEQFNLMRETRKTFHEICQQYCVFLKNYLETCVSFHSWMPVRGLSGSENVDQLFEEFFGVKQLLLSEETRSSLHNLLEQIQIPLTLAAGSIEELEVHPNSDQTLVNDETAFFIPSITQNSLKSTELTENVASVIKEDRWSVIFGDPGCGKTTLLRWLTKQYTISVLNEEQSVILEGIDGQTEINVGPSRLPILIRVGELTSWLDANPSLTVMDYIGHQTWYGLRYSAEENAAILREFIQHQHAIILIDGLDEVSDYHQRRRVVNSIDTFIRDFVSSPVNNILSSDDKNVMQEWGGIENDFPAIAGGNQIVITSRCIGYHICPLQTKMLSLFSLQSLDEDEFELFLNYWLQHVHKRIMDYMNSLNLVTLNREEAEIALLRKQRELNDIFVFAGEKIRSHPLLLSLACSIFYTKAHSTNLIYRTALYELTVRYALNSYNSYEKGILSTKELEWIFRDMALHLHQHCPSGLVDIFDLTRLTETSLKSFRKLNSTDCSRMQLHDQSAKFLEILNSNIGFVAARGLDAYGFAHLSFQEYFVALSIVNSFDDENQISPFAMADRLLAHMTKSSFYEPLVLALDWIRWKWHPNDFNEVCAAVVQNYIGSVPIGALFLVESQNELSDPLLAAILNHLLLLRSDERWFEHLRDGLKEVKLDVSFFEELLQQTPQLERICRFILSSVVYKWNNDLRVSEYYLPSWISASTLWAIQSSSDITENVEILVDIILRNVFSANISKDVYLPGSLATFLSENKISDTSMHPTILSIVIALCGGLFCKRKEGDKVSRVEFVSVKMHCSTPLSDILMQYFLNDFMDPHQGIEILRQKCEEIIVKAAVDDSSRRVVDAYIALICLQGVQDLTFYESLGKTKALSCALHRLKIILYHLRQCYLSLFNISMHDKTPFVVHGFSEILQSFLSDGEEDRKGTELRMMAIMTAYTRLTYYELRRPVLIPLSLQTELMHNIIFNCARVLSLVLNFSSSNTKEDTAMWIQDKHPYQLLRGYSLFPVAFVSPHVQILLERMILTNRIDKKTTTYRVGTLPFVIILAELFLCISESLIDTMRNIMVLRPILLMFTLDKDICHHNMNSITTVTLRKLSEKVAVSHENIPKEISTFILAHTKVCVQKEVKKQQKRIFKALRFSDQRKTDLKLFTASVSLAYLSEIVKTPNELFKEATVAISAIKDPVLRIVSFRHLREIARSHVEPEHFHTVCQYLFDEIQDIPSDTPLLVSTLLLLLVVEEGKHLHLSLKLLLDNVLEKSKFKTEDENEAQDNKLIYHAIARFVDPKTVISSKGITQQYLSEVLQLNSTVFTKYFQNNRSIDPSHRLLLAQMYLTELAVNAQFLTVFKDIPLLHETASYAKKQIERLWSFFRNRTFRFPHRAAVFINIFVCSESTESIDIPFEHLKNCRGFEDRDRRTIEGWLRYHNNVHRVSFALLAAFLLIKDRTKISSSLLHTLEVLLEKCFHSEIDQIRQGAQACFIRDNQYVRKLPYVMWSQSMWQELRKLYYCSLHEKFEKYWLSSTDDADALLELEHQRIFSPDRNNNFPQASFFYMVAGYSKEVWLYLEMWISAKMKVLTVSEDSLLDEYIATVLWNMIKKAQENEWNKTSRNLLTVLMDSSRSPFTQLAVICSLDELDNGGHILSEVLLRQFNLLSNKTNHKQVEENSLSNEAFVACLRISMNFGINPNNNSAEKDLQDVWQNVSNTEQIRDYAVACYFSHRISKGDTFDDLQKKLSISIPRLYFLNILIGTSLNNKLLRCEWVERTFELIVQHWSELIKIFICDLYSNLCAECMTPNYRNPQPVLVEIADILIAKRFEGFRQAIKESTVGEERFKEALYRISKRGSVNQKHNCIRLYAIFQIGTAEFIDMLFIACLEYLCQTPEDDVFFNFPPLTDRELIESLFAYLKSSSMIQRYLAARWLVELVLANLLSAVEVHNTFQVTFEDPASQQILWAPFNESGKPFAVVLHALSSRIFCLKTLQKENSLSVLTPAQIEIDFTDSLEAPLFASCSILQEEDETQKCRSHSHCLTSHRGCQCILL